MACYRPLDGYRLESGGVSIGYEPSGSLQKLRVPCGSCFGCKAEYAEMWAVRLEHEAACWSRAAFVTLTYDEDNVPWRGLELDHLQRFLKRLRKARSGVQSIDGRNPIRYFAAGEYGGETRRPHFHAALFNVDLGAGSSGHSDLLSDVWPYGFHSCAEFTPGRARYIAGYAVKKIRGRLEREREYAVVNYETGEFAVARPEFAVMSRRPGIGAFWYEKFRSDLLRGFVSDRGGVRRRLPRFYRERLLKDPDYAYEDEVRREDYLVSLPAGSDTVQRRAAKESVHRARVRTFTRERGN